MRHRLLVILMPAILAASAACDAANRTPVTLRAQDTSVQPLVRRLLDLRGWSYIIGADVPDDHIRSVAIVDVPLDVALRALSRSWRFTCAFEDRICSVTGRQPQPDRPSTELHVAGMAQEKNPYYLVRGSRDEPNRVSLGQSTQKLNPALVEYAATVSMLVTPESLDDLAFRLRRQVDASPYLQEKMAHELIGLTQFRTILRQAQDDRGRAQDDRGPPQDDRESLAVAMNVAEDLSTSLIRVGFNLVERAQLDKACDELCLHDTALIDPATAGRLGRMTGCGIVVVGSISDRGGLIVINARLVETATGRALAADRVQIQR